MLCQCNLTWEQIRQTFVGNVTCKLNRLSYIEHLFIHQHLISRTETGIIR